MILWEIGKGETGKRGGRFIVLVWERNVVKGEENGGMDGGVRVRG